MSYLALYRKYRPVSFDDFVGQNEVSKIIKNEILNNRISHAYLFSGPRGTGKTSTAKIIAKMINCSKLDKNGNPCGKCIFCSNVNNNDIVEIDAASNNGVDEIRELRDKVNLVPSVGKYKVYIIDEVHMLTTQAFNALLKTLEEPPSHAVFILATTEFYKIPATVVSRCQKFQFLRFTDDEIVDRLKKICKLEKINIDVSVLYEIARLSDGGLRDAINMLDQLSAFKTTSYDLDDLYKLNGVVSYKELSDLLFYIINNDSKKIISFLENINSLGKNLDRFLFDFVTFFKEILIYKTTSSLDNGNELKNKFILNVSDFISTDDIFDFIIKFNDVMNQIKNSNFSLIILITNFLKISNDYHNKYNKNVVDDVDNELKKDFSNINSKSLNVGFDNDNFNDIKDDDNNIFSVEKKKIRINNAFSSASKRNKELFISKWNDIKDNINTFKYNSLIGIIDDVDVLVVGDNNIIFLVKYNSLIDRIYNYINDFEGMLFDNYGIDYKIVFVDNDEWLYEKNNYISNIKNGKKYTYIVETVEKKINNVYTNNDVDKLISIVGNDVIKYE